MDLKKTYQLTIEALDKKEQELGQEKQALIEKAMLLDRKEKELAAAYKDLEDEKRSVKDVKDVKVQKEANEAEKKGLYQIEVELKKKENELKKYENRLYEISSQQKETDDKLRQRETAVAERERTYKEEVEKAFAANLAKNLLTK